MKVNTNWEEGQRILDELGFFDILRMSKRKTAPDTVVPGGKPPFKATVVSSTEGANIIKKLEERVKKSENLSKRGMKSFISDLAIDLEADKDGSGSQYATFETVHGGTVTIRLSDHNAKVSNFDYREEKEGISIVISRKADNGVIEDGEACGPVRRGASLKRKRTFAGASAKVASRYRRQRSAGECLPKRVRGDSARLLQLFR